MPTTNRKYKISTTIMDIKSIIFLHPWTTEWRNHLNNPFLQLVDLTFYETVQTRVQPYFHHQGLCLWGLCRSCNQECKTQVHLSLIISKFHKVCLLPLFHLFNVARDPSECCQLLHASWASPGHEVTCCTDQCAELGPDPPRYVGDGIKEARSQYFQGSCSFCGHFHPHVASECCVMSISSKKASDTI